MRMGATATHDWMMEATTRFPCVSSCYSFRRRRRRLRQRPSGSESGRRPVEPLLLPRIHLCCSRFVYGGLLSASAAAAAAPAGAAGALPSAPGAARASLAVSKQQQQEEEEEEDCCCSGWTTPRPPAPPRPRCCCWCCRSPAGPTRPSPEGTRSFLFFASLRFGSRLVQKETGGWLADRSVGTVINRGIPEAHNHRPRTGRTGSSGRGDPPVLRRLRGEMTLERKISNDLTHGSTVHRVKAKKYRRTGLPEQEGRKEFGSLRSNWEFVLSVHAVS
jgi:hypothetical protein